MRLKAIRIVIRKTSPFIGFLLTMTLTNEGGTFRPSGMIIEPKFSLLSKSKMLNQSMLNIVKSPGNSNVTFLPLYCLRGSKLMKNINVNKNSRETN